MTQITEKQYDSLKHAIYMTLISSQHITEGGEVCERGMGEMGECEDAAKLVVDEWMTEENIQLVEIDKPIKSYDVYYCYGGKFKGEGRMHKTIQAISEDNAREIFAKEWRYEEIYSVTEMTKQNG